MFRENPAVGVGERRRAAAGRCESGGTDTKGRLFSGPRQRRPRRDDRDVIRPTAIQRELKEVATQLLSANHALAMLGNLLVADMLGQPIAAEQQHTSALAHIHA